jgi:polyphosphate:AMP phosphotransferase
MLQSVDMSLTMSKDEYREAIKPLDLQLGVLQRALHDAGIPVMVVLEGWEGSRKGEILARLVKPLDPRGFEVHAIGPPQFEEDLYPPMRRFWIRLPEQGKIAIFDRSWYRQVLEEGFQGFESDFAEGYERIRVFERQMTDSGMLVVKIFLHISRDEQAKRFKKWNRDPAFAWRVGESERRQLEHYDEFHGAMDHMLKETGARQAPWTVIPAENGRYARWKVVDTLARAFEGALAKPPRASGTTGYKACKKSPLDAAALDQAVDRKDYNEELSVLQDTLHRLQHLCYLKRLPVVMVYEGWDAAGKGGNIRRLVREMDPRGYKVIGVAAPTGQEITHHYLWRFWRPLPKAGHLHIFDRSWYGRVLVERVEGFATAEEWQRAYREINEFEAQLTQYGTVVIKFWVHISKEEQLARFEARQADPHKQWKITDEDWRNREQWDAYWAAVSDMIALTSTPSAPWNIIEGNDKLHARLSAMRIAVERIDAALEQR